MVAYSIGMSNISKDEAQIIAPFRQKISFLV